MVQGGIIMQKEIRIAYYDKDLQFETFHFDGIVQPFPNHFHDYYVIGYVEAGTRCLLCKNREYVIGKDDILLFNPNDSHSCTQCGGGTFAYTGFNIPKEIMLQLAKEVTGTGKLPCFTENVIKNTGLCACLHYLYQIILDKAQIFEKEETLLILIQLLIGKYGQPFSGCINRYSEEIENVCIFISENFNRHITLDELCKYTGLSKSTLLRAFTRAKGVTPYRYLQAVRIGRAKELLEQGVSTADVAMQAGFSDQSHFSNFFNMFIGLPPAAYRRIFKEGNRNNG